MPTRIARAVPPLLILMLMAGIAMGQNTSTTTDQRLDRLEKRLEELEQKYQQDIKTRDDEIVRLRAELDRRPQPTTSPSAVAADDIEKTRQDILKDIESREPPPTTL